MHGFVLLPASDRTMALHVACDMDVHIFHIAGVCFTFTQFNGMNGSTYMHRDSK